MTIRRLWCGHVLLTGGVTTNVILTIDGDRIVGIDDLDHIEDLEATIERMPGLTLPGFANAHSHAFHRALRGRTQHGTGNFWTWREQMYRVAGRLTPDNYFDLARATFAEMLLAGYTCVGEFHYVHHDVDGSPYGDPNAMGAAIIAAAAAAGIRLTLLDTCYLRAGAEAPLLAEQARFSDGTAGAWASRVDALQGTDGARVGAAIHSVRALDAHSIATVAAHANGHSMPLHVHVSEQIAENEQVAAEHGCSPTAVLARAGALSPRFTAVHATHIMAADIDLYATAGCTCCFCPTTERDLADGIGPSASLQSAGVALSIGSDQHAVIDPFEELRGIEMNERVTSMRRGTHSSPELLRAGSAGGYRSLGWPNGGAIEIGSLADLTTVSLGGVRMAGWSPDELLDAAVFAATAADVTDVMVGGRTVVSGRAHTSLDVAAELRDSIAAVHGERP